MQEIGLYEYGRESGQNRGLPCYWRFVHTYLYPPRTRFFAGDEACRSQRNSGASQRK